MHPHNALVHAVARQLLLGLRESLIITGQVGYPVEVINGVLQRLQDECAGCIVLTQPYAGEPRVVVTVVGWEALKHAAGINERPR
jgi:hypothetical protein